VGHARHVAEPRGACDGAGQLVPWHEQLRLAAVGAVAGDDGGL
jgi:hypothetical protein